VLDQCFSSLKGWIDGQAEVGSGAFQVGRDGERSADDSLSAQRFRCPGKTNSRLECFSAVYAIVKTTTAFSACRRGRSQIYFRAVRRQHLSTHQVEVYLSVIFLHPRSKSFVSNSKVKRQTVGSSPVILDIARDSA